MIARLANTAWAAASLPAYSAFRKALRAPRQTQQRWLASHLQAHARTAFATEHALSADTSSAEFAERVPVRDYDEHCPWIDRIRSGEPRVLTADPVDRLATSSGSTAAVKLLPQTARLQREFNAAIGPWMVDLFRRYPAVMGGSAYWSITPSTPTPAIESAVPVGFDDDASYLGGVRKRLIDAVLVRPMLAGGNVFDATADAMRDRRDLRLISVWHPSFLEQLLNRIPDWRERWPRLALVSAWGDAAAAGPFDALWTRMAGVACQLKGLLATEGVVTFPFAGKCPIAVRSHYVEFEADGGAVHGAADLDVGGMYAPILTTGGGLWRYRLGDCVEVTGRLGNTPTLRLVGRTDRVVDLVGEKLSEGFVASVLLDFGPPRFAMLAPTGSAYTLFTDADVDADALESALRRNPHYDHARNLGQLQHVAVCRVGPDAYRRYTERLVADGMRLGDIKPTPLDGRPDWDKHLAPRDA